MAYTLVIDEPQSHYDAEHIVRLHNRQPLYDALVDAVKAYMAIKDKAEEANPEYDGELFHEWEHRTADLVVAMHDLDSEEVHP